MIRGKLRTLSNISHGAFARKKSRPKSRYLFLQKSYSQMLDWVLSVPLMVTFAGYGLCISSKTETI